MPTMFLACYGFVVETLKRWSGGLGLKKAKTGLRGFKSSRCFSRVPSEHVWFGTPVLASHIKVCARDDKHSFDQ